MGAGASPFANEAYLPVALKYRELHVVKVKGVKFLTRCLEYVGLRDKRGGHLPAVKLAVLEELPFYADRESFEPARAHTRPC